MAQAAFENSLEHISSDEPLNLSYLYGLSMMGQTNLASFQETWPTVDADRRRQTLEYLTEITENSFEVDFDPIFILSLNDTDPDVQAQAIKGLWESDDPALIPPLIHLLKAGQNSNVRATAATALGMFVYYGEVEEIDEAAQMLTEQALLEAIRQQGEEVDVVRRAVESIAFSSQEGVSNIIEMAYYHDEELMRISAIFAMGRSCNKRWKDIVIEELDNDTAAVRFEATRACGEIGLADSVPSLIKLIDQDSDTEVVQNAIWSLGQIGGPVSQEVLEALMESEDAAIIAAAEEALDETTMMQGVIDEFFNFMADKDDDFDDPLDDDDSNYKTFNLN